MAEAASRPYRLPGSRLKATNLDSLDVIGLPSKGDNRLLDFKTQETYYASILHRYNHLGTKPRISNPIDEALASLSINGEPGSRSSSSIHTPVWENDLDGTSRTRGENPKSLGKLLMAMRKLREGIVASARKDDFALRTYVFMIRATILEKHIESYQPALIYLLHTIHPIRSLSTSEYEEFVGYHILDVAIRQNDLAAAYQLKYRHHHVNTSKVGAVLRALVHGDWNTFWKIERLADIYQKQLMSLGEHGMREHAVKCVGKSYLSLDRMALERILNESWAEFEEKGDVDWHLEGNTITIRRVKGKSEKS